MQQVADLVDAARRAARLLLLPLVWRFRPDSCNEGEQAAWFAQEPGQHWADLRVDQPWTKQGYADHQGIAWYAVRVTVPDFQHGGRVYLYFAGVNGTCRVWVDGKPAGAQSISPAYMWQSPFALDVTELIRPARQQWITVQVHKDEGDAGICRPVELRREDL